MRNVRVFYKKRSALRFVSHLDMNRFMPRVIHKTNIPAWYTEGFNSHIYINFALPLSLGFESDYEVMDFKITDDNFSDSEIQAELEMVMPDSVEIIKVCEPMRKVGEIAFAEFKILFEDAGEFLNDLKNFLKQDSIIVSKKTKKGNFKEIDLSSKIKRFEVTDNGNTLLTVVLSAGADNVNPQLLISAFAEFSSKPVSDYSVTRIMLYTENLEVFE